MNICKEVLQVTKAFVFRKDAVKLQRSNPIVYLLYYFYEYTCITLDQCGFVYGCRATY